MSIEIIWTLFTPRHTKKQESHPVLATSICFSLIFDFLFPSLSVACYCCITKIFLRNVHECLQCPPHWNTWGKVSSLTLWSIPAPQLEPQLLVPPLLRIFFFLKWWAIFFYSSWRIGFFFSSKLVGLGVVFEKIYKILFGVSELAVVIWSSAVVVSNFKVSMAQETVEVEGGATGFWGEEMAFYVA